MVLCRRLLALTAQQTVVKGTTLLFTRLAVAKTELGTKRIDPETGRKFYDLNKDPIVSPYTGKTYPRSYFEEGKIAAIEEEEEVVEKEVDAEDEEGVEVVSLEEADDDVKGDDLPDLGDDEDVDLGDDEDDTFLADEEEEDDDVADMIGVGDDDDEV
nr:TIGR02300 family protein [Mesorhizobium sp. dw_380]